MYVKIIENQLIILNGNINEKTNNKMAIIALSGKISSGKDTIGKIIQILANKPDAFEGISVITDEILDYKVWDNPRFKIKKFAGKVKDIVCVLLNCTREQLENTEFKNTELGEEWWYYTNTLFNTKDKELIPYLDANNFIHNSTEWYIIKLTPRILMQLVGTECGRQIIHPNIWSTSLMSEYTEIIDMSPASHRTSGINMQSLGHPNWIITDLRFPNELEAVRKKGGFTIRINRIIFTNEDTHPIGVPQHLSEIALDNASFDYTINNDGTVQDLVEQIKVILIKEKVI